MGLQSEYLSPGPLFDIQYYAFLFPQGSDLREPIKLALLKLRKKGDMMSFIVSGLVHIR